MDGFPDKLLACEGKQRSKYAGFAFEEATVEADKTKERLQLFEILGMLHVIDSGYLLLPRAGSSRGHPEAKKVTPSSTVEHLASPAWPTTRW